MSWYAIGTVSVTNNNVAITGAGGTAWAANIQAGDAFKGPDEKLYEVQSVNSDTAITLARVYAGATLAGAAYAIIPTQGRVRDLAAAVLQLITDVGDVDAALTVVSGRVGLGKSPNASAKLDVSGQVWVDAPTGDATLRMLASGVEKGKLAVTSAGRVYIESNGAEVMTLLNGNVGIGVIPGTWAAAAKLIDFSFPSFGMSGAGQAFVGFNLRESTSGNWVYKLTDTGQLFQSNAGGWVWSTAVSGASGAAATLLERMRIASTGSVTINAPSSGNALTVSGGLRVDAAVTTAAPTGGAAGAPPAAPVGYVTINIAGTDRKIAFYA